MIQYVHNKILVLNKGGLMEQKDNMMPNVIASIKRIGIDQSVFGAKSRAKLQKILKQEGIKELFEKIPEEIAKIEGKENNVTKEYVQKCLMDAIIKRILFETAIKVKDGQATDEKIEEVIERRIAWSAIAREEGKLKRN